MSMNVIDWLRGESKLTELRDSMAAEYNEH